MKPLPDGADQVARAHQIRPESPQTDSVPGWVGQSTAPRAADAAVGILQILDYMLLYVYDILHCIILHYIALYRIILYFTILYYIIL